MLMSDICVCVHLFINTSLQPPAAVSLKKNLVNMKNKRDDAESSLASWC